MTHALGALAFWAGLFFAVRALWLLARWAVTPRGPASAGLLAPLGWSAVGFRSRRGYRCRSPSR
jgi:hypothetical protein